MKTLLAAAILCLSLPAFAQFDSLQKAAEKAGADANKAAEKAAGEDGKAAAQKAQEAAKAAGNKAVEEGKKKGNELARKEIEEKINDKLMADAKKNQCEFKSNSDAFAKPCTEQLKNLVDSLVWAKGQLVEHQVEGFKFEVSGHTDSKGKAAKNLALSQKRAAKIVKELVAKKVPKDEIVAVGMGSKAMLENPDDTKEKQAKNRRFELRVRLQKL